MEKIDEALNGLKKSISKLSAKHKSKKPIQDAISQLSSCLNLMKAPSLSSGSADKLAKCLREHLVTIYAALPTPSLKLTASLCQLLYDTKILTEFTAGKHDQKVLWDSVLNALLSGVLDFLDDDPNEKSKEMIGATLYPAICPIFFSISISHMSVDLRCTGYTVLAETAAHHRANQQRLLDVKMLGGIKLGTILWRTRDFLVMESILNLFARMVPSIGGKAARNAFIQSVFVKSSPDDAETGEKLATLLQRASVVEWDQTAAKIVDILASSNIAFPQPFAISEITASGHKKPADKVYVDDKGFLANVIVDSDSCDSLVALYPTVRSIDVTYHTGVTKGDASQSAPRVNISLASPPTLGKEPVYPQKSNATASVVFTLKRGDVPRLRQALGSRGMGGLLKVHKNGKLSILENPANLEIDLAGTLVGNQGLAQRIDNLSQLYGTNDSSDGDEQHDDIQSIPVEELRPSPKRDNTRGRTTVDSIEPGLVDSGYADLGSGDSGSVPTDSKKRTIVTGAGLQGTPSHTVSHLELVTPLRRTKSQMIREAAFGLDGGELSEVESVPAPPKKSQRATAVENESVSRVYKGRIIDSDNEKDSSTPTRPPVKKHTGKKKAIVIEDDEDDIEEVLPASRITPTFSRRRSVLAMSNAADEKLSSSTRNAEDNLQEVTPSSEPSIVKPSGVVDSGSLAKASGQNKKPELPARMSQRSEGKKTAPEVVPARIAQMENVQKAIDAASSSPIASRLERKAVKSALRNRNGTFTDMTASTHVSTVKRRRSLNPNLELEKDADAVLDETEERPAKRRKGPIQLDNNTIAPTRKTVSTKIPDDAVVHDKKSGFAPKRRTSPTDISVIDVDYDHVPDGPMVASPAKPTSKTAKQNPKKQKADSAAKKPKTGSVPTVEVEDEQSAKQRPTSRKKAQKKDKADIQPIDTARYSKRGAKKLAKDAKDDDDQDVFNDILPADWAEGLQASTPKHISQRRSAKAGKGKREGAVLPQPAEEKKLQQDHVPTAITSPADEDPTTVIADPADREPTDELQKSAPSPQEELEDETTMVQETNVIEDRRSPAKPKPEAQKSPVISIDLTEGSPDVKGKKRELPTRFTTTTTSDTAAGPEESNTPMKAAGSARHSVTFADDTFGHAFSAKAKLSPASTRPIAPRHPSKLKHVWVEVPDVASMKKARQPTTEDIASVLNDIHEALIQKITSRVEGVRHDVRVGRQKLIADVMNELQEMHGQSIDRYNTLIDLEAEYATFGRSLIHALDDVVQTNRKIQTDMKTILENQTKNSISRKIPESLFSAQLPASILALQS